MNARLVVNRPRKGSFKTATADAAFTYRDLGISAATGGRVGADVSRLARFSKDFYAPHFHKLRCHIVYVTKGWLKIEYEGYGAVRLKAGDCAYQPPGLRHRLLDASRDVEVLQATIPADVETVMLPEPARKKGLGRRKRS